MSMKSSKDDDDIIAEINMTPLIDIMLVLLIIFMVTSSISLESGLDIDIPKTASKTSQLSGEAIIVSIDKGGAISVQGRDVSKDGLEASIRAALTDGKTNQVILEGDTGSSLGNAIEIMDLAKRAGAEKFSIAAQTK